MGRSEGIDTDHSHQPAYPHAGWKMDIEDSGRKEVSDPLSPEGKDRAAEEESGHRQSLGDSSPSTPFTFTFPSASFPSGSGNTAPTRRRAVAPSTIPNFPSSNEARNPPSQTPFTLSPSRSIAPLSPFRSPATPPQTRQPFLPIALPQPFGPVNTAVSSPWHTLAATSGAPTPSIESEPSIGRNSSPHLGYPFERLNIGGSWSGANLWAEGGQGRRSSLGSLEGTHGQNAGTSPSKGSPKVTSHPMSGGLSLETVAKYRAVAGKTSSPKGSHKREEGFAMEGVESIRTSFASPSSHIQVPGDLARRRASLPKNSLNALSPTQAHSAKSPSPLASSSSASTPSPGPAKLQPLSTLTLRSLIPKSSTLILDLRPPSAFHASHLPSSHSLPIPSTLLRRPAFTLQKLTRMLTPPFNEEVAKWREKKDVVLLDLDSTAAPDGSVLEGLASKFEREGFTGRVWFVKGGQKAVQSMSGMNLSSEDGEGAEENEATPTVTSAPSGMMAGRLGKLAFLHGALPLT